MPRVVSLIASATEIVAALDMEQALVGRSHECDYPPGVVKLPVCTEPRFDVHGDSAAVDRRVKDALREAASVYRVHEDVLNQLRPDVIITQTQCAVCAVSQDDVEAALGAWAGGRPTIVSLHPDALADVWRDIEKVAAALGVAERGRALIGRLQKRMADIERRARNLPRPTIACLEWTDPLMAAGNWVPGLVEMAGGDNRFGAAGRHAPWLTWEELHADDPDVIIAMPCGYGLDKTREEMTALARRVDWSSLRAVRSGRVYVADGNQYFNRPGPRLVESLEILAEILHPERFGFGHEGAGWERFTWPPSGDRESPALGS